MDNQNEIPRAEADEPLRGVIRETIEEFVRKEQSKTEPAYKTELLEERKRREKLEQRLNELVEENRKARQIAEEADRGAAIRAELQRLGVAKVDLAFKAVKDDVFRTEDGRILGRTDAGEERSLRDHLSQFVNENPEFLPARLSGGSGTSGVKSGPEDGHPDISRIKPGMSADDRDRIRQEIIRVASQSARGL